MKPIKKLKEAVKKEVKLSNNEVDVIRKYIVLKEGVIVKVFDTKAEADLEAKVLGCVVEEK